MDELGGGDGRSWEEKLELPGDWRRWEKVEGIRRLLGGIRSSKEKLGGV